MATIITNQATINYRFRNAAATAVSNTATTVLGAQVEISKNSLTEVYRPQQIITYIIGITNRGSALTDVGVVDDLGTYTENGNSYTPLTYIGPAQLYINGAFNSVITPDVEENGISFEIANIPAGGNAQIVYQVRVNGFAGVEEGSEITNTAIVDCNCPCDVTDSDSHTIRAEGFADIRIIKSVCPNPVGCGEELTYVFDIYNYGNIPANNVVLTDRFEPALSDIAVSVNGVSIPDEDFSYVNGVLTLPAAGSDYEITVPAATFERNDTTGEYEITPGQIQIIVTGII